MLQVICDCLFDLIGLLNGQGVGMDPLIHGDVIDVLHRSFFYHAAIPQQLPNAVEMC